MLAALLSMAQVTAPAIEAAPADIVVTARRRAAMRVRIVTKTDRRTSERRCVFKRRSGDDALDAGICAGLLACAPMARTSAEMTACVTPVWERLIKGAPTPSRM